MGLPSTLLYILFSFILYTFTILRDTLYVCVPLYSSYVRIVLSIVLLSLFLLLLFLAILLLVRFSHFEMVGFQACRISHSLSGEIELLV